MNNGDKKCRCEFCEDKKSLNRITKALKNNKHCLIHNQWDKNCIDCVKHQMATLIKSLIK